MKKVFFLAALALTMAANAQVLNVTSVEQLDVPAGDVKVAGIAPDGSYILLTTGANQGLKQFNLADKTMVTLSEAPGAGYNATVSTDGKTVVYRENSYDANRLRQMTLKSHNLTSGQKQQLVNKTRSSRKLAVSGNLVAARPTCSIEDRQLMITVGGTTTQLSPLGANKSYIWPSISPNGQNRLQSWILWNKSLPLKAGKNL